MKQVFSILIVLLLAFPCGFARAASGETIQSLPSYDADYREQIRLADLGYLTTAVTGVPDAAGAEAMTRFFKQHAAAASRVDDVFLSGAPFSGVMAGSTTVAISAVSTSKGRTLAWDDAQALLTVGATYVLTSCTTGAILHVRYEGGNRHANIIPVSEWDKATLESLFGDVENYGKLPVVITLGGTRYAASLQANAHSASDDSNATEYHCLYFDGCISDVGNLTDVEHREMLQLAAR